MIESTKLPVAPATGDGALRRRRWHRAAIALCCGLACSTGPTTRDVDVPQPSREDDDRITCRLGINHGAPIWEGFVSLDDARVAALAATGAKTVRLDFRNDHHAWDEPLLAEYDRMLDRIEAAGMTAHGLVTYEAITAKQSEYNDDVDGNGLNAAVGEYADVAQLLIERYGHRIRRWELWNEGNSYEKPDYLDNPTGAGGTYVLPRVLAHMIAETYVRVRDRVDSGEIELVLGGLLGHNIEGPLDTGAGYLETLYADGVWDYLDAEYGRRYPWRVVGVHPYVDRNAPFADENLLGVVDAIADVMDDHDDDSTIAITEIGWPIDAGPDVQAANLERAFALLAARDDIDEISWFHYQDVPAANLFFGLIDADGNPRPALTTMQQVVAACRDGDEDDDDEAEGEAGGGEDEGDDDDDGEGDADDGGDAGDTGDDASAEGGEVDGGEVDGGEVDGGEADGGGSDPSTDGGG